MDTRGRVCSPESLAAQTPDQAPPAAPLECNVLYRYRAKIRAVHLPIAGWQRGTADTVMTVTDFLASGLLIPNSVDFKRQFRAACGYAELGMTAESTAELNAIDDEFQHRPEVLQLRLHHLMRKKHWSRALTVSRRLCRAAPQASAGFLHAGFCLHQIGRTREAKELLLRGPTALLKEPIYYYNMGCYEVLLGNVKYARVHLQISFKMDSSFRDLAKRDPDLRPLHATL